VVTRQLSPAFCTIGSPPDLAVTASRTWEIDALGASIVKTEPPVNSTPKLSLTMRSPARENSRSAPEMEYQSFGLPTMSALMSPR